MSLIRLGNGMPLWTVSGPRELERWLLHFMVLDLDVLLLLNNRLLGVHLKRRRLRANTFLPFT